MIVRDRPVQNQETPFTGFCISLSSLLHLFICMYVLIIFILIGNTCISGGKITGAFRRYTVDVHIS